MTLVNQRDSDAGSLTLSVFGILLGWAGAVLLIPEIDYYQPGRLVPAGVAMSLGLLAGPLYAAATRPDSLFRLEYVLAFGLFYWVVLDAAQGAYGFLGVSRGTLVAAFAGVGLFAVAIWLGSFLMSLYGRLPTAPMPSVDARFLFWAALICFLLGMLRALLACKFSPLCIAGQILVPRYESVWHQANIGNFDTLLLRLKNFGYLILPLAATLYHLERRMSWRVVLPLVLGLIFLLVLIQGGGRRQVGMVLGMTGLVWILLNRPARLKDFIAMGVIAAVILMLMEFMHTWRYEGLGEAEVQETGEVSYMTHERLIRVDKNLLFMSHIMERVPRQYPHTGMTGIEYILTAPIPRALYPAKPSHRGFPLTQIMHLRVGPGWSWTASAVGDFYLIGGFFAIVCGGLFFGALANLGNRLLEGPSTVRNIMLYSVIALTLFIGLRAVHEITITGLAVLAVWGIFYARRFLPAWVLGERANP